MKRTLTILLAIAGFVALAGQMFLPIYAVFVQKIGGDLLTAGSAYALYAITIAIVILIVSRLEDRTKQFGKLVLVGSAIMAFGFSGYLFVTEPIHLFIVQFILGLGFAVYAPAFDALYAMSLDRGKFASEMGYWEAMFFAVSAVAAFIGGFVAHTFGFVYVFYLMIFVSLLGVVISFVLFIDEQKKR